MTISIRSIETSLIHTILPPRKTEGEKSPALILLHGRGTNEYDLLGLSEYFDDRFFFISARAPFNFQLGGGFTWYDILDVGRAEPKMFAESYKRLTQFHHDVKKNYPIDPSKIFYLGFSMGTMMSYAFSLTNPNEVRGVVANSGYIPEETELKFQWNQLNGVSFFVAHGVYDPVIPVEFGRRSRVLLEKAKADLFYREYEMAHQITEESLRDIAKWLSEKSEIRK
jgi:phospholipase/carboxylesterase